ncbi:Prefoldin subunit [Ceratobasidium sp. AG-Ba]|nr:Prefoldin subunit [Ceratobasidium sp. AG-Ba]
MATTSSEETKGGQEIKTNPRGIPSAPFVSDIEKHLGGPDVECESALRQFQEAIAKYRYMEINLKQRKAALEEKIPDIKKSLGVVELMIARKSPKKDEDEDDLGDEEDQEAELEDTDTVYLWLGANVMLSYTLTQAQELLTGKLTSAKQNYAGVVEDLEFLREQITVMEVNTARVYNWDVRRRRLKREAEAAGKAVES